VTLEAPPTGDQSTADEHARSLRRSLIALAILGVLIVALLLAVPGLEGVARSLADADLLWIAAAIGLEFLSGLGYVMVFELVFARAPTRFAARLAWSELAFQGAVSLGGTGGVALGAWVLHTVGLPAGRIAERSAVLFLLTSAANAIVLVVVALGLAVGILPGPGDPLLSVVPAAAGTAAIVFFLALPRWSDRRADRLSGHTRTATILRGLAESIHDAERLLLSRDRRALGAFGYLVFDIAVLWATFRALGAAPPLAAIVLGYQIGYLANIVPVPGGIGALDAGLVGALVLYGIDATQATGAVLAYHAIALWVPALLGTVSFALLRRQLVQQRLPRLSDEERGGCR
jgi:uncharacterized membrane protein YbhN (UPF0104 family)